MVMALFSGTAWKKSMSGSSDYCFVLSPDSKRRTQQTYYLKTGDATTQYTFGTDTNGNITLTSNGTTPAL
jgi:hypothetical protein